MTPEVVTLWRCTVCGKWSHAQRRPKTHERYVVTGTEIVTEMESWDTGAYIDIEVPAGGFQPCGPFARWEARRVEESPNPPTHVPANRKESH
ncbi:hypothetical protein [Verrucosispora sp. WMMC514]|uniref:hypothetical protein n=1 Tax=Verrucosispora sp. WMMC514 TaxID=3015156 RepID=UPI00248C6BE9|nr:hypothetical protein [Verrucosispora sp. WMMC514]WBB94226.1 hypothetical protein O7597_15355 [Verrucosispora sp. WMMC514]